MSDSVDQDQQETPAAETVTTDTQPISLSGYPLSKTDERMIRRGVEQEMRIRKLMSTLVPPMPEPEEPVQPDPMIAIADTSPEPEEPVQQEVLYKRRAHWFQTITYLRVFVRTVFIIVIGFILMAWIKLAPPAVPAPPPEEAGSIQYEQLKYASLAVDVVVRILDAFFTGIGPHLWWLVPVALFVTFAYSLIRGFQNLLLWLFTYRIVTKTHFAIIVRLPDNKRAKLFYTAINIDPKSKSIPRSFIGTPDFEQSFWAIVFGFGGATFETAVQLDQAFHHIEHIAGFKKFQKIMDPVDELASA